MYNYKPVSPTVTIYDENIAFLHTYLDEIISYKTNKQIFIFSSESSNRMFGLVDWSEVKKINISLAFIIELHVYINSSKEIRPAIKIINH